MLRSVAYTKLDDKLKGQLRKLLYCAYDFENAHKRLQSLIWTCEKNPHAKEADYRYYMIKDRDGILAYNGRMPAKLLFKDRVIYAFFGHETLVHPEYRRKGLAIQVNRNLVSDSNGLCVGLWANKKLLPLLAKIGWKDIGELRPLKKLIRVDGIMKDRYKAPQIRSILTFVGNLYLRTRKQRHVYLSNSIGVFEINRFEDHMQEPLNDILKKFRILTYRDTEYLNWKYIDIPYRKYKVYGVEKNDHFEGYVVLRVEKGDQRNLRKGIIVDLLCDTDEKDCFASLVLKAEEYFIKEGCDFVVCLFTFHRFVKWMRKLRFFQQKSKRKSYLS